MCSTFVFCFSVCFLTLEVYKSCRLSSQSSQQSFQSPKTFVQPPNQTITYSSAQNRLDDGWVELHSWKVQEISLGYCHIGTGLRTFIFSNGEILMLQRHSGLFCASNFAATALGKTSILYGCGIQMLSINIWLYSLCQINWFEAYFFSPTFLFPEQSNNASEVQKQYQLNWL